MKETIYTTILLFALASCNNTQNEVANNDTEKAETTTVTTVATPTERCYLFAQNKDTTTVNLTIDGNKVSGKMHWNPWQKDGAIGNLNGTKNNDTIAVMFDYIIEGSNQKEEKYFILKEDKLLELQAALDFKNDVMVVKNKADLKVKTTLNNVNCK